MMQQQSDGLSSRLKASKKEVSKYSLFFTLAILFEPD